MKVALVYDRINKWGGAERVLLVLHKLFPDAPIFTSVYSKAKASWADEITINPSFLQHIPLARVNHEMLAPFMPMAFETQNFDAYDVVISITSEAAKGIITKPSTLHICICLTPTRYLWSGYDEYFSNPFIKFFMSPAVSYLKSWDNVAASRPDYYIAISETVKERIKKYYNRNSDVIYPPASLYLKSEVLNSHYKSFNNKIAKGKKKDNFFLVVSRLSRFVPYKRIDLVIKAANRLKVPLKIVGEGRDMKYFREMAGSTIEFVGPINDWELADYYHDCRALIFPGLEDFGLVMVEAQAHGKPVIAYRGGGATEIVREGITGEFFERQTIQSLVEKLEKFDEKKYNSVDCVKNALRFSQEKFENRMLSFIEKKVKEHF